MTQIGSGISALAVDSPGVMLALVPPAAVARALAVDGGEASGEHHITLYYLGKPEEAGGEEGRERLHQALLDFATRSGHPGLTGRVGGHAVFTPSAGSDGQHVLVALWDIPGGAEFYVELGTYLGRHGVPRRHNDHGWIPHETIRYSAGPVRELPDLPPDLPDRVHFDSVALAWAGQWTHYPLVAPPG